jgi:hypothetical protein
MKNEQFMEASQLEAKAQNLLTDVSRLIEKARLAVDTPEQREVYLRAMRQAQKAYSLIARAKKLSGNSSSTKEQ